MIQTQPIELRFIRHAPVQSEGLIYGRRDLSADLSDITKIAKLRNAIDLPNEVVSSPACRCLQTVHAIWPELPSDKIQISDNLWEQNFGDWEGMCYDEIPDLGQVSLNEIAVHAPPNGESFSDVCVRVRSTLKKLCTESRQNNITIIAHAGVIRAAIAMVLENTPAALKFDVTPLSLTRILMLPDDQYSILSVNEFAR